MPPLFRRCGGTFPQGKVRERPRRRKPSPPGKVDRAQPGPDEGKQPKSEKQATLNGSVFHSMVPVSLLGCDPSSVTPYGVPPSPWGKATSGGGLGWRALCLIGGFFPLIRHALRRATFTVGEGFLPAGAASGEGVLLPSPGGRWPPQRPEEGRYQVGPPYRPTPVTPAACHPLPGEGLRL